MWPSFGAKQRALQYTRGLKLMRRRLFLAGSIVAVTAPGLALAQSQTPPAAAPAGPPPARARIEPQNALEYAFVDAIDNEDLRPAFRRELLISQVALALSAREPGAPPRSIELRPGFRACLIFTSPARARAVMGPNAPMLTATGREALERVRGTNVVININLAPMLVLEAEDVETYLALPNPVEPVEAPRPPAQPAPPSAGPAQ